MLLAALYEIIPLDRGISVGQGAVGGGLVLDIAVMFIGCAARQIGYVKHAYIIISTN